MAAVDAFTSSENERNDIQHYNSNTTDNRTNDGASYLATPPSDAEQSPQNQLQQPQVNGSNIESEQDQPHTSTETIRQLGAELQRQLDDEHDRRVHENDRTTETNRDEQRFNYLSGADNDNNDNSRLTHAAADERPNYLSGYDTYDTMQREAPQTPLLERLANAVGRTSGDTGSSQTDTSMQNTNTHGTNDTINTGVASSGTSSPSLLRRVSDSIRRDATTGSNGLVDLRDDVREANESHNNNANSNGIGVDRMKEQASRFGQQIKETGQRVKDSAEEKATKFEQQIRESGEHSMENQSKLQNSRSTGFDTVLTESASLAGAVDEDDTNSSHGFASLGERLSNFFGRSTNNDNSTRSTANINTSKTDESQRSLDSNRSNTLSSPDNDDTRNKIEAVVLSEHAKPGEVVVEETVITRNEENGSETVETGIVMATPDALPLSEDSVKRVSPTDTNASVPNRTDTIGTPSTPITPMTPITPTTDGSDTNEASIDSNDRSRSTLDPVGDHLLFVAG